MSSDCELLRQYTERADESAFAEVVRRHTDLVYSVALRVTCNGALAEDVTQSVFIQLAQRARQVSHYASPVGWLHTTARRRAIDAVRGEARRQIREQESIAMHHESAPQEINWKEISPLLDEVVNQLSVRDRDAVLLRFFKSLSYQEVGAELQLGEDAARKRVDRALEKLREYFLRRGVTASSALLTAALMENSVQAAPVGLAARVTGPSLTAVTTSSGSLFLKILFMSTKTKFIVVIIALLAITATLAINWSQPSPDSVAAKSAPAPADASVAKKPSTTQIEKPVVAAANPATSATASTSPAASTSNTVIAVPYVATPQADLKTAVLTAIHFLDAQDTTSVLKTLMSPADMANEMNSLGATSLDELPVKMKDMAPRMTELQTVLTAVQNQTPIISPDGLHAAFIVDPPIAGHKDIEFKKIDGLWYLQ